MSTLSFLYKFVICALVVWSVFRTAQLKGTTRSYFVDDVHIGAGAVASALVILAILM